MWIIISFSLLLTLALMVCVRNLIIRNKIIKRYNSKDKKGVYKQIIKRNFETFIGFNISELAFKVKSNLWASKVKIHFTVKFVCEKPELELKGTIFFENQTFQKDIDENLWGVLLGEHEKSWIQ